MKIRAFAKKGGFAFAIILGLSPLATVQAQSPKVSGNNAALGSGPLATTEYPTGPTVSFVPTGATDGNCGPPFCNGRGDLVLGNKNFYTELSAETIFVVGGATNFIHAAPWNGGAGGADVGAWALTNPRPGCGVQDIDYKDGYIYVLTGYPGPFLLPGCDGAQVFKVWAAGGPWIGPVTLTSPAFPFSDGFTVLPNGNFLVNDDDGSCTYNQFDPTTGAVVPGTAIVAAGGFGDFPCTGVDNDQTLLPYALYVSHNGSTLTKNTSAGAFAGPVQTPGVGWTGVEDISLQKAFVGIPGAADCEDNSNSALAMLFGGIAKAAGVLGYPSVLALENAIDAFCLE